MQLSLVLAGVAVLSTGLAPAVAGVPDLRRGRRAGPLTVYPDDRRADLFYYPPGNLALVADTQGKPDFLLLLLRYTDPEEASSLPRFRNLLSFRVAMAGPSPVELRAAAAALAPTGQVELRPLPITRLEAAAVYTPLGGAVAASGTGGASATTDTVPAATPLPAGHFDAADSNGTSSSTAYWTERAFTLRLDDYTAQLFDHAFRHGQLVLSFGYAFYASGIGPDQPLAQLTGSPALVDALRQQVGPDSAAGHDYLISANAFAITPDAARWPDLLELVDLNAQAPPSYPALELYCYDFRDEIRDDLYAKVIELRAEGVTGRLVRHRVIFSRAAHDVYAHTIRFPYAVRLDRPYRYQVSEIRTDGTAVMQPWHESRSWFALLDVTTVTNADSTGAR